MSPAESLARNEGSGTGLAERCLAAATGKLPAVRAALAHREMTIGEHVERLVRKAPGALQGRTDLLECVRRACVSGFGEEGAEEIAAELGERPTVLTANHHGVDFFAQSVQSTLALSLAPARAGERLATVVLACGAIPMNNLTYPRGMLVYAGHRATGPLRIPVFPERRKHDLVSLTGPFDRTMVARAEARLTRLSAEGGIPESVLEAGRSVLHQEYAHPAVLAAGSYSEQATLINSALWPRIFREPQAMPRLAYLELERLATEVLSEDLVNTSSLAWAVLFDAELRSAVHRALDGVRGCWNDRALAERLCSRSAPCASAGHTGTTFFWGVDERARPVPLRLSVDGHGIARLIGVGGTGTAIEVDLNPVALFEALHARRIVPSLFTSYLCMALARGITCLGGYYQAEYLPSMQSALVRALRETGCRAGADAVLSVTTDGYLSGMQAVLCPNGAGGLVPAGPLEIIAAGGLSGEDVRRIAATSVYDAHLGSTVETVADAARELMAGDWERDIAADLGLKLTGRAVVKVH